MDEEEKIDITRKIYSNMTDVNVDNANIETNKRSVAFDAYYEIDGAVHTDQGCLRTVNEDSIKWAIIREPASQKFQTMLVTVADGMGGHAAGEIASRMAVDIIQQSSDSYSDNPHLLLRNAYDEANKAIYDYAQECNCQGMGTTCTTLLLLPTGALLAHVGDSRLYLIRGHRIFQLSEDDSLVAELVRAGKLTISEARHNSQRNVILRALGTHPTVQISIWQSLFPVNDDDTFVVCTDGLTDLVADDEICNIAQTRIADKACSQLIDLALARGGHDNISVGVFKIKCIGRKDNNSVTDTREYKVIQ